jgi:sec-independent protein translocase protein TatC
VARLRPIDHEDRLSVVEHLDELRSRLIFSLIALGVAFALCFWQEDLLIDVLSRPLAGSEDVLFGPGGKPVTLSPTEQFTTTIMVSAYGAILLALPVVLYQVYAFVLPAFSPRERKVAMPLLLMVPFLFVAGVLFGYFVVMKPALDFLLNFNADQFTTALRARDYFSFVGLSLLAIGLLFQVPVGILGLTRLGVVTPEGLRRNRRFAIVGIAVLAALLPTIDPVTLILEMIPLVVLYELSIVVARAFGRPREGEMTETVASPGTS